MTKQSLRKGESLKDSFLAPDYKSKKDTNGAEIGYVSVIQAVI
jgi:hypothetical protein